MSASRTGSVPGLDIAIVRREIQRTPSPFVRKVDIGAVVQQIGGQIVVSVLRRHQQRAPAVTSRLVNVRSSLQENFDRFEIVGTRRNRQSRELSAIRRTLIAAAASSRCGIVCAAGIICRCRLLCSPPCVCVCLGEVVPRVSETSGAVQVGSETAACAASALRGSPDLPPGRGACRDAGFDFALMSAPLRIRS